MKKFLVLTVALMAGALQAAGEAKIINKTGNSLKINTATVEKGYTKNKKEVKNLGKDASFTVSKLPITYLLEPKGYSSGLFLTIDQSVSYVVEFKTAGSDDSRHHSGERYLVITKQ
jgi:opacity protein-like surface antigen